MPGPGNQQARECCFTVAALVLLVGLSGATSANDTPMLSEDRYYLESQCNMPGIQEILLKASGEFTLTSYHTDTRKRVTELHGQWSSKEQVLTLSWADESASFQTKSRVHELIGEKFLYLSFKALPNPSMELLKECEFVDRRVLDHFFNRNKKPAE